MRKLKVEKEETLFSKVSRKISDFFYNLTQPFHAKLRKRFGKIASKGERRRSELIFYFTLMALPVLQFVIFYIIVNSNSFLMAFQKYNPETGKYFMVGFDNFREIINEITIKGAMYDAISSSLKAYLLTLLLTPLRVLFPYYIHKKLPCSGFFKVMLFLPHILSTAILCILYQWFLEFVIPAVADKLGADVALSFKSSSGFMFAWLYTAIFGFTNVLMYLGTMSGISRSVEEYARIDGCSIWQEFCYITLPIIFPTILIYLINGIAGIFSNQLNMHVYYGNNYAYARTVGFMIFVKTLEGTGKAAYPQPAAIGLMCTCVITPLLIVLRRIAKRFERY